jgi:hypothetical protein
MPVLLKHALFAGNDPGPAEKRAQPSKLPVSPLNLSYFSAISNTQPYSFCVCRSSIHMKIHLLFHCGYQVAGI